MEWRQNYTTPPPKGPAIMDVKPLRCLSPMLPESLGLDSTVLNGSPPFVCFTPFGPSGQPLVRPLAPAMVVPLNEHKVMCYETTTTSRGRKTKRLVTTSSQDIDSSDSEGGKRNKKKKKKSASRKKHSRSRDLVALPYSEDPREAIETILMTFDGLRRRLMQVEEMTNANKRQDLRAGSIMMDNDLRNSIGKKLGTIPGVEIGDIYYFRFELCLVGLHAPSMAGIDYINTTIDNEDETLATSIVSSGGYENEMDDIDTLIYSGQGGSKGSGGVSQIDDQKLERGNLALERSLHRANQIRVIRGVKDLSVLNGRIYIYDGLYKIDESWIDKGKSGFNIFKYKLLREPGQPAGFATWKMTEKWRSNPSSRGGLLLPDLSSGEESLPVCVVNEVDMEKRLDMFSYSKKVRYLRPLSSKSNLEGCPCPDVCVPGDSNCTCAQTNDGVLPYSSTGLLVSRKSLIYECSSTCRCSDTCRNKVTQKGIKFRFEVFRTANRGWGLRSWDPIRAGTFICEYTGEVIDMVNIDYNTKEDDYIFEANYGDQPFKWNYIPELLEEQSSNNSSEVPDQLSIIISAKRIGNFSRFMNHSCSPNVLWQAVKHDHGDAGYPHIMFFAMKHIPPMTELTYDYGQSGRRTKPCLCGSRKCRGIFG